MDVFATHIGCYEENLIVENEHQIEANDFALRYLEIYSTKDWQHESVAPFIEEFLDRTLIDYNSTNNDIQYNLQCGSGVSFNIGLENRNTSAYVIGILDMNSGQIEIQLRTESLTIESDYFRTQTGGFLIVTSKIIQDGLSFIQNNKFSIIVADMDPILGGDRPITNTIPIPARMANGSAYPNPFQNTIHLDFYADIEVSRATIRILSLEGQLMKTINLGPVKNGRNILSLDLEQLKTGMYIVHLALKEEQLHFQAYKK